MHKHKVKEKAQSMASLSQCLADQKEELLQDARMAAITSQPSKEEMLKKLKNEQRSYFTIFKVKAKRSF